MTDREGAADALRATARRLGCFDLGPPSGPGWHDLPTLAAPAAVHHLVDRMEEGDGHGPRPRAVAGAYVGGSLAWAVVQPTAAALAAEARGLDVGAGNVSLQIGEGGWATRIALREPRFAALPDDPAASDPTVTVVPDEGALAAWTADRLVTTFTPLFTAVRAASPYGTAGLWGALADTASAALWLLHEQGATHQELDRAWQRTEALVDALQARVPLLRTRSRRFRLLASPAPVSLPLRGTCCLYYRTPEAAAADGDGLCATCPRRSDPERIRLVEADLRDGR